MDVSLNNILGHARSAAIPDRYRSSRYMSALTYRLCMRIASRYQDRFRSETTAGALCIYVMPYIFFCLPMKYIALEARRRSEIINIHLRGTLFPLMPMWSYEEVPLFALACFAQRYGVPFRFHNKALEGRTVLTFKPSPVLVPDPCFNYEYRSFPSRTLVCTAGYRDFNVLPPGETDVSFFWARAGYRSKLPTDTGFRMDPRPFLEKFMEIRVERQEDRDFMPGLPTMAAVIDAFFIPVLEASLKEAHKLVQEADIRKLYVCDFPFLETWVMKDAVAARGGEVALIPHGYNRAHIPAGESSDISKIVVACRSTALEWTNHTRAKILVHPAIARSRSARSTSSFEPGRTASIHVFGCHEFIGCIPRFAFGLNPLDKYLELFRELVATPLDLYFRERDLGITFGMLQKSGIGERIRKGEKPPSDIEGPNMIFVFVGPATSGIYEAVGRGIPCIRIKDPNEEEYLEIEDSIVPALAPKDAAATAIALASGQGYDNLVRIQMQWFLAETEENVIDSSDL